MLLLDCESEAVALKSISAILGLDEGILSTFLMRIPLDEYWEGEASKNMPSDEFISMRTKEIRKIGGLEHVDGTCFFHMTRAFDKKDFESGLLPLPAVVDRIWDRLFDLAANEFDECSWNLFRKEFESMSNCHWAHLYRMKMKDEGQNGPFGALVRQSCLKFKEKHFHNYFRIPESIEDICICLNKRTGYELATRFEEATKPYLVKFWHDTISESYFGAALCYLWHSLHGSLIPPCDTDSTFSGEGRPIPASDILAIEEIEPSKVNPV